MRYNEKYDLYIDEDYVIYYWNKIKDKLMQRPIYKDKDGYLLVNTKIGKKRVHRVINKECCWYHYHGKCSWE